MARDTFKGSYTDKRATETAEQLLQALATLAAQVERCQRPAWRRKHETLGVAALCGILKDVQKGSALLETLSDPGPQKGWSFGAGGGARQAPSRRSKGT